MFQPAFGCLPKAGRNTQRTGVWLSKVCICRTEKIRPGSILMGHNARVTFWRYVFITIWHSEFGACTQLEVIHKQRCLCCKKRFLCRMVSKYEPCLAEQLSVDENQNIICKAHPVLFYSKHF